MAQKILVTGAGGNVSRMLRPYLLKRYGELILTDRHKIDDLAEGETTYQAELSDLSAVRSVCDGVDGIIHFGGQPREADWDTVNEANIQGLYNLFEAARLQGVKRVVFASSNHVVGMYTQNRRIGVDEKVRPDTRYGLSKAFGEAAAALYADKFGLRVLSIRIGNVSLKPGNIRHLALWLHPEDMAQLCAIGLEHPDLHHEIVFGVSDNARGFYDNENAFRLGYRPIYQSEVHSEHAIAGQAELAPDAIGDLLQGGPFASQEFSGDIKRTTEN